ncbi:MAG: hypothetical protein J2P25_08630 [Nocardiopsaceae bacterium]|nr:hypothetical protein [Nocardiopsaceae bacterium]
MSVVPILAVSVAADVAITKGETPAGDRTCLSFGDGTARGTTLRVIDDLPHLVVESAFGLERGLWGALARGGFSTPAPPPLRRNGSSRLLTDLSLPRLAERDWPDLLIARAAVTAVVNRWGDGPDTPDGVRDRMRAHSPEAADLADGLDDESIRVAVAGVRRVYRRWRALPPGGTLRLSWPLDESWLRSQ